MDTPLVPISSKYRSAEIDKIMMALSKAQGAYKSLAPNQDAPGGKFANLEAILGAVREALSANEIGFTQHQELLDEGSGAALVWTQIGHSSGQWMSSCARIVPSDNERKTGNIYEIHKRRQAAMLLGIAPSSTDPIAFDDNGAMQAEEKLIEKVRKPKSDVVVIDRSDTINKTQYDELVIELDGYEDIVKDIYETYGINTLADMPASEYHKAMAKIRKIKKVAEEYNNKGRNV